MIKQAIKEMLEKGEFEKIINNAKGRDKKNAKLFYDAIKDTNLEKTPEIVIIMACKSYAVWQDMYVFMKKEVEQNVRESQS